MDHNDVKKIFLFSDLSDNEAKLIYENSVFKTFDKGEIIFFDSEPYQGFYGVLEGSVKIYKISKDGKEHIIHFIEKGNTFAEVPLFERWSDSRKEVTYPANTMALEDDTQLILIRSECFLSVLEKDPGLCMKMLASVSKRMRYLTKHIEDLTLKDITKRLAGYLVLEYNKSTSSASHPAPPDTIELDISKYDLACYLGTINETVSRVFRKLQDEDILHVDGRNITIKNLSLLKEVAK